MTPFHVSYNVAQQLRFLGFHYKCHAHYNISNKRIFTNYPAEDFNDEEGGDYFISAPTLEQVHRWLREEKGIALNIIAHDGGRYHWSEVFLPNFKENGYNWYDYKPHPLFGSYEEALTNGIEWSLHAFIASGWKFANCKIPPAEN